MGAFLSGQPPTLEILIRRQQSGHHTLDLRLRGPLLATQIFQNRPPVIELSLEALCASEADEALYGALLKQLIFGHEGVAAGLREARLIAEQHSQPLRLALHLDPDDDLAHSIDWELLPDPDGGGCLSTQKTIHFSRNYASKHNTAPLTRRPRGELRAVVAVAAPLNLPTYNLAPIDANAELARVREALGSISITPVVQSVQGEHTTRQRLLNALDTCPDILILVCHGSRDVESNEPTLWFEDDQGLVCWLRGTELIEALMSLGRWPTLIVLMACDTAGGRGDLDSLSALGPRLVAAGCPAVVAARGKLSLTTAAAFMHAFFTQLQHNGQIEGALAHARSICKDREGWWRPVLYTRLEDGMLWRCTPGDNVFSGVPDVVAYFVGRADELLVLREALCSRERAPSVVEVVGASGLGKTALVAYAIDNFRRSGRLPETVLWGTLGGYKPDEILAAFLADLGLETEVRQQAGAASLPRLRTMFWHRMQDEGKPFVLVLDQVTNLAQLRQILPERLPDNCRLVLIGQNSVAASFQWPVRQINVSRLPPEAIAALFERILQGPIAERYAQELTELAHRLDGHTHLIAAAALFLLHSGEHPDEYLARLARNASELEVLEPAAALALNLRDLAPEARLLLSLFDLSAEDSWSAEFLSSCMLRPVDEIRATILTLVTRNLLQVEQGERFRANALARMLALRLMAELPTHQRANAVYLFVRSCLDLLMDQQLALALERKTEPPHAVVRRVRGAMLHMLPHLRRAMVLAEQYPQWRLLERFARCSRLELIQELICNAPEVRITAMLAHLYKPVLWAAGEHVRVQASAVMLSHELAVHCNTIAAPLTISDAERYANGLHWPLPTEKVPRPRRRPELTITLTASQIEQGVVRGYALVNSVWSGVNAPGLVLLDVDLVGVRWRYCDLSESVWIGCDARRSELVSARLVRSRLARVNLRDAQLRSVDLRGANLQMVDLRGADLSGAQLQGACLEDVDLRGANLRRAQLDGARLQNVQIAGSFLDGSSWRGVVGLPSTGERDWLGRIVDQQGDLAQGADLPAAWTPGEQIKTRPDADYGGSDLRALRLPRTVIEAPAPGRLSLEQADLSAADLAGAHLNRVSLRDARLVAADLSDAVLEHADLSGAELLGTCLERANLRYSRLADAQLRYVYAFRANLRGADLRGADLRGADLRGADLRGADLRGADLRGADLRSAHATRRQLTAAADLRDALVVYRGGGHPVTEWSGVHEGTDFVADKHLRYNRFSGQFSKLSFANCELHGAICSGRFWRCSFAEARLPWATLGGTFLLVSFSEALLVRAQLGGIFHEADFTGANLEGATLNGVFVDARFEGARLAGADLCGAALVNVDLRGCEGLTLGQLRQAESLRGSVVPAGLPHVGALRLPGDETAARLAGVDPNDGSAFDRFCAHKASTNSLWKRREAR